MARICGFSFSIANRRRLACGGIFRSKPTIKRSAIRPPAGQSLWARAAQQWLIPSEPSRIEKSVIRRPRTFLLGDVPASGTRDLVVRFDSKTNGTETSGSSSQRPLGLSSRVAFCYLRSVLPVSSKGRLSAGFRRSTGHILYRKPSATPLSSKLATQSISEPIEHCKDDYLRLPRRWWTASFECVALAMISPALRAKPLSSTGATSALDFNERFAGPCRSSEKRCRFFFRP